MGSWTSGADDTSVPDASAEGNSGQASPAGGSYEAGRLPLLAYALQQTWQRREGRRLTVWVTEPSIPPVARYPETSYATVSASATLAASTADASARIQRVAVSDGGSRRKSKRRLTAEEVVALADVLGVTIFELTKPTEF